MARITIEQKWWTDPRRVKLGQLLGNYLFTESAAILAWRLGQEYWEKGLLIPGHIYVMLFGSVELLHCNLARLHEKETIESVIIPTPLQHESNTTRMHSKIIEQGFVYVRGAQEFLSWGREIREKRVAGGKKSAQRPRDAKGRLLKRSYNIQHITNPDPALTNTVQLSGSGSGSGSSSSSSSSSSSGSGGVPETAASGAQIWEAYRMAWMGRYKAEPLRNVRINSQLKLLSSKISKEDVIPLMAHYLTHEKGYYVSKKHTVGPLLQDCDVLIAEMRTGTRVLGNGYRPINKTQALQESNLEVAKRAIERHSARGRSNAN